MTSNSGCYVRKSCVVTGLQACQLRLAMCGEVDMRTDGG